MYVKAWTHGLPPSLDGPVSCALKMSSFCRPLQYPSGIVRAGSVQTSPTYPVLLHNPEASDFLRKIG